MPIKLLSITNLSTDDEDTSKFGFSTALSKSGAKIAIFVSTKTNSDGNNSVWVYWNDKKPPAAGDDIGIPLSKTGIQSQIYKFTADDITGSTPALTTSVEKFPEIIKEWLGIAAPSVGVSSGSGSSSSSSVATGNAPSLQQFLAGHVTLYIDSVSGNYNAGTLDDKILSPGGWGPASRAALAGFVEKIKERIPTSQVKAFTGNNPVIDTVDFTSSSSPVDLQFAWVATHPVGQSGYDAAKEIGFDTRIPIGLFADAGTPLRKLHEMLALSPAPFVIISGPIPADAKLEISAEGVTNTVDFKAAYSSGVILGIGINIGDTTTEAFSNSLALNTAIYEDLAKSAISGKPITMKMTAGDKSSTVKDVKMGTTVNFGLSTASAAAAAAPATAAPAVDAKSLSGEANLQMNTAEGLTASGTRPAFPLQNVYMTTGGSPALNSPEVVLQKRTGGSGDVFDLSVSTAEDAVILIPIVPKTPINEAAGQPLLHWTGTLLTGAQAAAPSSASGQPHVALKKIEWGYDRHYRRFGLPGVGNIRLIAYEPSTSKNIPRDVNVISIEAAIRDGYTGNSKWDPIEYAIAMYIANDDNIVGTRLYTSAALNREMNSFQNIRYQTN